MESVESIAHAIVWQPSMDNEGHQDGWMPRAPDELEKRIAAALRAERAKLDALLQAAAQMKVARAASRLDDSSEATVRLLDAVANFDAVYAKQAAEAAKENGQ